MKTMLQRLFREPFFHFLVLGGLMFAVYYAMNPPVSAPRPNVIAITPTTIERLRAGFTSAWRREPDERELAALIESTVREEVYYREAVKLGLDQGDALVKRRMRQKMEFLMDSASSAIEPAEGELEAFYEAGRDDYLYPPRLAFEQVYLGEAPDEATVEETLSRLRADPDTDLDTIGAPSLLPVQTGLTTAQRVSGVFGPGFFENLAVLEPMKWTGPVMSAYGAHVVRVLDKLPARAPELAEIRARVLGDWRTAKHREIQDRDYAERRKNYVVEIDRGDGAKVVTQ